MCDYGSTPASSNVSQIVVSFVQYVGLCCFLLSLFLFVFCLLLFFLMIRRPPRSTLDRSSAASDVYKRQVYQFLHSDYGTQTIEDLRSVGVQLTEPQREELPTGVAASALEGKTLVVTGTCLLYTSPSPRDRTRSRMPSSA